MGPDKAWFVEESRAIVCERDMAKLDDSKRVERLAFDRCSPGTLAFGDRKEAEAFVEQNGGNLRSLSELLAEAK